MQLRSHLLKEVLLLGRRRRRLRLPEGEGSQPVPEGAIRFSRRSRSDGDLGSCFEVTFSFEFVCELVEEALLSGLRGGRWGGGSSVVGGRVMSLELGSRSLLGSRRRGGRRSVNVELGLEFLEEGVVFLCGRSRRGRRRRRGRRGRLSVMEEGHCWYSDGGGSRKGDAREVRSFGQRRQGRSESQEETSPDQTLENFQDENGEERKMRNEGRECEAG